MTIQKQVKSRTCFSVGSHE